MSLRLTVHLQIQAGKHAEFEAAIGPAIARVKAEDAGCEAYDLYRSVDDACRYVMVEAWTDAAALEAHRTSPAMAAMAAIAPFVAGAPVMHRYED